MRRLLGLVLLLSVCWPLLSPVLASAGSADEGLPACCRRTGAHHCMGKMAGESSSSTGVALNAPRCQAFPVAVSVARDGDHLALSGDAVFAEIFSHPAVRRQVEARARVALDRARQKRGPPSVLV